MKKILKPVLIISFFLLAVFFSCEKDYLGENTCKSKDPVKDITWIKNEINFINQLPLDESQYIAIMMAKYNGETIFYSTYCNPEYEAVYPIKNCSGTVIGYYGEILPEELKEQIVIWKSVNCICTL
jgi:hypothetical protein